MNWYRMPKQKPNNYITCLLMVGLVLIWWPATINAYDFDKYSYVPPFIAASEKPSVLLLTDTSGSMDQYALATHAGRSSNYPPGVAFDPDTVYDGYFDPYAYYRYIKCDDDGGRIVGYFEENESSYWTDTKGEKHGHYDGDDDGIDNNMSGATGVGNFEWSGNFLNYITMRRMDLLKRVLIGGRRAPANFGDVFDTVPSGYPAGSAMNPLDYLVAGDHEYWNASGYNYTQDALVHLPPGPSATEADEVALGKPDRTIEANKHFMTPYGTGTGPVNLFLDTEENTYFPDGYRPMVQEIFTGADWGSASFIERKMIAVRLPKDASGNTIQPQGLIQEANASVSFGLMVFDTDTSSFGNQGGDLIVAVGNLDHECSGCAAYGLGSANQGDGFQMDGIIEAVNNLTSDGSTPLGESLTTAVDYFMQKTTPSIGSYTVSTAADPYFNNPKDAYSICAKGNIIVITDGRPQKDTSIPAHIPDYANGYTFNGETDDTTSVAKAVDDVARYARITDLRTTDISYGTPSVTYQFSTVDNNLSIYPIFAFGPDSGDELMKSVAANGTFVDKNNDNRPNTPAEEAAASTADKEWDFDNNSVPDFFYKPNSGQAMRAALTAAIGEIIKRVASGTAASIIAGSKQGSGAIFQALFFPEMQEPGGINTINWTGYLHALFIDEWGNMWEDTNQNGQLDLGTDRIVQVYWSAGDNQTKVNYYTARLSTGAVDTSSLHADSSDPTKNNVYNIKPIWEAGRKLSEWSNADLASQRSYSAETGGRYIFTWIDADNDGVVDAGETKAFDTVAANQAAIQPYLDLPVSTDPDYIAPDKLINYVRGIDQSGYRSRQIDFFLTGTDKTWRLGDIVYSTPTIVGRPAEALDLIYDDSSYRAFYYSKKSRRQVIYVGANDGMLHAFNAGFFNEDSHAFELQSTSGSEVQYALGQELWAYIPFELLPHLQALPQHDYDPDYGHHVCYVDLKPRVMDVKFDDGSWHTVLVCGMRFGGGEVSVAGDVLKSAYFALDITDPEVAPTLLWSFSDTHGSVPAGTGSNKMGFTTSYPGVVTVYKKANGDRKNFLLVGSGPTTLNPNYDPAATPAYPSKSDQFASLYAIDIETGDATLITTLSDATEANSYFGDALAVVDPDLKSETVSGKLNWASEVAYIGISSDPDANSATPPKGKLFRLRTVDPGGDPIYDPASWSLDVLIDVDRPVTAPPNVTVAALRGQTDTYKAYIDSTDLSTVTNVPLIHFGTGEYLFNEDKEDDNRKQAFYGVIEPITIAATTPKRYELTFASIDRSWLMNVSNTEVFENGMGGLVDMDGDGTIDSTNWPPSDPLNATTGFTSWPDDPPDFNTWLQHLMNSDLDNTDNDHFSRYHGFKYDLESDGERVIGQPGILGGITVYSSFLPSNVVCQTLGNSRLYATHYLTGSAYFRPIIGTDDSSTITVDSITYEESKRSESLGVGMSATPSFHASLGKPTAFIQTSTGQVLEIELDSVYKVLSPGVHLRSWRH